MNRPDYSLSLTLFPYKICKHYYHPILCRGKLGERSRLLLHNARGCRVWRGWGGGAFNYRSRTGACAGRGGSCRISRAHSLRSLLKMNNAVACIDMGAACVDVCV